ncbi:DUF3343 domain-containing protein [Isachenkonia alkalipeptolytica]|uniref:DUF3343 domain-containing protein n=1 Tax=Isachenkonia alkalipeptolytica TaxID=2565777 RepID=A0AA44BC39_9CLOT|nr:DUF3343 domain-containing protein [Isachenkonia alkalipeptolytica]NBG86984.1 DUF3343 domain-containing protein [Isachenkonia alkalipeptolytica]
MSTEIPYVITFDSTHAAMEAEKRLLNKGVKIHVIPTPRQITANCGLSVKIMEITREELEDLLRELQIEKKNLYRMESFHKIEQVG